MKHEKIAVLMGGVSEERPVSLRSGKAVAGALRTLGHEVKACDVRTLQDVVEAVGGVDKAFVALHGRWGEDGTVQGILDTLKVPYTGSSLAASALAMDKVRSKWVWQAMGLPTPPFEVVTIDEPFDLSAYRLGFPVIVKPAHEGSSIGVTKVDTPEALKAAIDAALALDREVLIEKWIDGAEYTAAIVGETVLPLIRIETPRAFYDYTAKYESEQTQFHCPCGLDLIQEGELAELAQAAFSLLGCKGWGRVDFMVDTQGNPWLIEVNTIPGMTDHSLVPMAAKQYGWSFEQLVARILETVDAA